MIKILMNDMLISSTLGLQKTIGAIEKVQARLKENRRLCDFWLFDERYHLRYYAPAIDSGLSRDCRSHGEGRSRLKARLYISEPLLSIYNPICGRYGTTSGPITRNYYSVRREDMGRLDPNQGKSTIKLSTSP